MLQHQLLKVSVSLKSPTKYNFKCFVVAVGAITNATILLETDPVEVENFEFSNRARLSLIIRGDTTGSQATSVVWRRNRTKVNRNTVVAGGSFFDGGGDTISDTGTCSTHMYRVGLLVTGYLPGEYSYTISNNLNTSPVASIVFRMEGKGKNEKVMHLNDSIISISQYNCVIMFIISNLCH